MRILELNFERGWRGGERQTLWTMQYFRDAGHDVELLARAGHPMAVRAAQENLPVHALAGSGAGMRYVAWRGRRYDVLHAQTPPTLMWCVLTRWLHGRPVAFTRRVAFELKSRFSHLKYRHADLVVAVSEAAARPLRACGVQDIHVIPSAVRPHPPAPRRVAAFTAEHGLGGRKILATAGAMTREKDPLMLVDAVAQLAARRDDFAFVHFGDGPLRESVSQRIREHGLEAVYRLAGFQQDVEDFFALMDGFVMSSTMEGLGSSVLDAFLARVPVASTDAGGLREVLADGRGLVSPVGDARALAEHMGSLLADDEASVAARARRVERAYRWVMHECSVQTMGERYLGLFDMLMRDSRR
jgi:glycosyltransferase involved in cell wall biosynthesis